MQVKIIIPRLGSSDESNQVKILRWLKRKGERVEKGEPLLEVETDKVNVEIESPEAGVVSEIYAEAGATASFNSVVALLQSE